MKGFTAGGCCQIAGNKGPGGEAGGGGDRWQDGQREGRVSVCVCVGEEGLVVRSSSPGAVYYRIHS